MTCRSEHYQQTFHSTFGAVAEARLVYLQQSGVAARLTSGQPTTVLEVGFGLGLNALLTADLALSSNTPLTYIAYDRVLHDPAILEQLNYHRWLSTSGIATELYTAIRSWFNSPEKYLQHQWQANTTLQLHIGDVTQALLSSHRVDAIYLDAFSPACNSECWSPDFLGRLATALAPGGTLATYCVQGHVRRALQQHGLVVAKHPGPPGKRETLSATRRL